MQTRRFMPVSSASTVQSWISIFNSELFEIALDELDRDNDLVDQVLEISLPDSGDEIDVLRYKLPPE
jgi:hypothetical protein